MMCIFSSNCQLSKRVESSLHARPSSLCNIVFVHNFPFLIELYIHQFNPMAFMHCCFSPPLCPIPSHSTSSFSRPPAFQQVTPDVFAYSSFCQKSPEPGASNGAGGDCDVVMTLAVSKTDQLTGKLRCKLW